MKEKITKLIDDAVLDLRNKVKTEEKGNWLSTTMLSVLILSFIILFLIFDPLLASIFAFIFIIVLTYLFALFIFTRNIK